MMMKRIFYIVYTIASLAFISCSGDIFDNIKEHAAEEKVYVGKFDKADALVGINRLEIDLMNAGRIPTTEVNIGKAIQTIYEYDGKVFPCQGVQSWLDIRDLKEPKLYRIKVYNLDEHGNKSIPVEAAAIPFTDEDLAALVVPMPEKLLATISAQFNWNNGLTSTFFDFYEMDYSYTDAQGVAQTKKSTDNKSLTLLNLAEGSAGVLKLKLKVVPKQNNVPILDTVFIKSEIEYQLPTKAQYLNARDNRKVKQTYIEGTTAKVTWGDVTPHNVVSELMYETTSGELKTVIVPASVKEVECPDAKRGVKYQTRSGFVAPGAVDTLYKDWTTSKYAFLSLPTGSFTVDPLSYRYFGDTKEPTAALPQSEYSLGTTITIEGIEDGTYRISDLMGGFYEFGRAYGADYASFGIFTYDGSTFTLTDAKADPWGTGFYRMSGTYDTSTKTLYLDIPWGNAPVTQYVFRLILHK